MPEIGLVQDEKRHGRGAIKGPESRLGTNASDDTIMNEEVRENYGAFLVMFFGDKVSSNQNAMLPTS